jgi:hypothetical protein
MTTEGGGSTRTPLEVLILALRHSRAAHLTGSTVLRQVLSGSYRDLVHGDRFDLGPVWELLSSQPKFDAAELMPAFALVKSWEKKLGKTVVLPAAMQELGDRQLAEMANSIHVPPSELASILRGRKVETDHTDLIPAPEPARRDTPRMRTPKPPDSGAGEPRAATQPPRPRLTDKQRRTVIVGASAVALLGFAIAGLVLLKSCQTRSWEAMPLEFAGEIPIAKAERSGPEVSAVLRGRAWLSLPEARRKDQLASALRALPPDVDVLILRDQGGAIRATARWYGKRPRQIAITLR